jgi:putative NIF3 family GTP cyclohydrolase 1 type 2
MSYILYYIVQISRAMEQFSHQEAFEEADLSVLGELDLHTFVQARELRFWP